MKTRGICVREKDATVSSNIGLNVSTDLLYYADAI